MVKILAAAMLVAALAGSNGADAQAADAQAADDGRERVAENFVEADVNADGALTLSEFTMLVDLNAARGIGPSVAIRRFGRYGSVFGRLDVDTDGLVTPEEIRALAVQTGN